MHFKRVLIQEVLPKIVPAYVWSMNNSTKLWVDNNMSLDWYGLLNIFNDECFILEWNSTCHTTRCQLWPFAHSPLGIIQLCLSCNLHESLMFWYHLFPFLITISQLTTLAAQQRVVNTSWTCACELVLSLNPMHLITIGPWPLVLMITIGWINILGQVWLSLSRDTIRRLSPTLRPLL